MARPKAICLLVVLDALLPCLALADAGPRSEPSAELVARGMRVLQMQGCVSCHSLDGSPSAGPSLSGRYGSRVQVRVQLDSESSPADERPKEPSLREVRFDRDYLLRSLTRPDAEVAVGFAPGVMPTFTLTGEQLDAVEAALLTLRVPPAPEPASPVNLGIVIGTAVLGTGLLLAWLAARRRKH